MQDKDRIKSWIADGELLRSGDDVNLIHVGRALAEVAGAQLDPFPGEGPSERERTDHVKGLVGSNKHVVFVLLDGFGINAAEQHLEADSFLRRNVKREIRSTFPATTSAALTSVLTGKYPSQHGLLGWTLHLPLLQSEDTKTSHMLINPLPFREHYGRHPLEEFGIDPLDVYSGVQPTSFDKITRRGCCFNAFAETTYSRHVNGLKRQTKSSSLEESLTLLEEFWGESPDPSFAYVYLNEPDATEHARGIGDPAVGETIRQIEHQLESFWRKTSHIGERVLVVTADHGHVVIDKPEKLLLEPTVDAELLNCIIHSPTVEPRSPCFHASEVGRKQLANAFRKSRLSDMFALVNADEAEELQLFGPGKMSAEARKSFGDFIAITKGTQGIFHPRIEDKIGFHGGMTPPEMRIPLIVVKDDEQVR